MGSFLMKVSIKKEVCGSPNPLENNYSHINTSQKKKKKVKRRQKGLTHCYCSMGPTVEK